MAVIPVSSIYLSAQEHIPMCIKHDLNIDITCEDCDEFICSQCAKTDHKDHDWKTIPTAGSQRRRELKKTLSNVKEKDIAEIDEKIKKASKQKEGNKKCCDSEVSKLQKHYDAIVSKLDEIKKNLETKLVEDLERKNAEVSKKKLDLEKKRDNIKDLVEFLEDKHGTMSDYSLIDNLRDLTNLVSNTDSDIERGDHSVRYRGGDISEGSLESIMGQTFDLDDFSVTETDSFQYGDECLQVLEAIDKDICLVRAHKSECFERMNIRNKKTEKSNICGNDVCVTDKGDVYFTDYSNPVIVRLSPSGSASTVLSTAPLVPVGICQSTEGGLLVILVDDGTNIFHLDSKCRRLVRHVTLTGDVIREYEYHEDGQTRLFTLPWRVRQNGNTDICVVNRTSQCTGELVILSSSGFLKSVYQGSNLMFNPTDVVCDSHCNIIVTDYRKSKIHLLSPDGEFMNNPAIVRLSPSGSASTVFNKAPLVPFGICQSTEGGLLVTLVDDDTKKIHPDSKSRRLVIHVTLTGDVIRETSQSTDELVILSSSGFLKTVYHGQKLTFDPTDVVCDSHCNIIVSDYSNCQMHLLSPDGEFMKYLLTENVVTNPWSMSLYKSTLWVGDYQGLIKVFQFNNT
ncbi:tripartite motif-containing protein 2-like [Magallana gigas]|uniref:tripartite motif-containing protein 2-like n=1 Tax=Magallana gigas TaxID=29159 RepID=UPI00333F44C2